MLMHPFGFQSIIIILVFTLSPICVLALCTVKGHFSSMCILGAFLNSGNKITGTASSYRAVSVVYQLVRNCCRIAKVVGLNATRLYARDFVYSGKHRVYSAITHQYKGKTKINKQQGVGQGSKNIKPLVF